MICALFGLAVGQWNAVPQITLSESVAVAQSFCRIVGIDSKVRLAEARINRSGWSGHYNGVELYEVQFRLPGKKPSVYVLVDAVSGDVVYAYDHDLRLSQGKRNPVLSKSWLDKLGRANDFKSFNRDERFDAVVGGYPFWNLNGKTVLWLRTSDGRFASFEGAGKNPDLPQGKPKLTQSAALDIMKKVQRADFANYPFKLEPKATLGCLYDEKQGKSKWAWKILLISKDGGKTSEHQTRFIDGMTGREFSRDEVQNSNYRYRSRASRSGMKLVGTSKAHIPLLDKAKQRLQDYGRTDLRLTEIEVNQGIRLMFGRDDFLELGPTGSTLFFRAHSDRSSLSRTVLLEKGKKFIQKEMSTLPEGKFSLGETGAGGGNTIEYRQWALGYPYSGSVIEVAIGVDGVLRGQRFGVAKRPAGLPTIILSKSQIEQAILRLTEPKLPKDTANHRYFMSVRPFRLAWLVPNPGGGPQLAWEVSVMRMVEIKNYSTRGGGSHYWFDAVTGKAIGRSP